MPATTPGYLGRDSFAAGELTTSTAMFPNVPDDVAYIAVTVRNGTLTYRSDGEDAEAGVNGIDLPAGTYTFTFAKADALKVNCIAGGAVAMDVEYYK